MHPRLNDANGSLLKLLRLCFKKQFFKEGVAWGYSSIVEHFNNMLESLGVSLSIFTYYKL